MELVFQMERTFCSLLSFALILNFSWLHRKIKLFVHDFSSTKVFVQPFHPQKGSKLVMMQGNFVKEMNLRQSHVANVIECLRLREEENTSSAARKRSVRKSRQVRSEYSGFSNADDDVKDLLKTVERNLMESFIDKLEDVNSSIKELSERMSTLEKRMLKSPGGDSDGGVSPVITEQKSNHRHPFQFQNNVPKATSLRIAPMRPARNNATCMKNFVRRSQQLHCKKSEGSLLQDPLNRRESCPNQIEMVSQRSESLPMAQIEVKLEENLSDEAT